MSSEIAIKVDGLSKCYPIYDHPRDRLKQFVFPRLRNTLGLSSRQYFREFWALRDVSFEVKKGEVLGVIGRNGSGKSTLLQLICGTLNPSLGEVQLEGRIAALLELGSGFNPEFSGRENVYLNGAVLGLGRAEIDARFDAIVAFSEIGDFIDQPVKTYSSGMLVRLAFAVAINVEPEILVVDEALAVGDELFQRKCFARIEAIRDAGATILFVSHSGAQIVELCDRALLMDGGEMVVMGPPKAVVGGYQKLLYAPADRRAEIREALRAVDSRREDGAPSALEVRESEASSLEESFDPALKPSSTIRYASRGASIQSPRILTLEGREVNCLVSGRTYRYAYSVRFAASAQFVRFGMNIKTISGAELGGAVSARSAREAIPMIDAGSEYSVEFEFTACFNQGTYFMNAGVVGVLQEGEVFLDRVVDVSSFRVQPQWGSIGTGVVNVSSAVSLVEQASGLSGRD